MQHFEAHLKNVGAFPYTCCGCCICMPASIIAVFTHVSFRMSTDDTDVGKWGHAHFFCIQPNWPATSREAMVRITKQTPANWELLGDTDIDWDAGGNTHPPAKRWTRVSLWLMVYHIQEKRPDGPQQGQEETIALKQPPIPPPNPPTHHHHHHHLLQAATQWLMLQA